MLPFQQHGRDCEADGASLLVRLIQQVHWAVEPVYQVAD